MKKIIWLIPFLFLLMGCSADYTLSFEDKTFKDKTFFYSTRERFLSKTASEEGVEEISEFLFQFENIREEQMDHTFTKNNNDVGYQYKSSFSLEEKNQWVKVPQLCYDSFEADTDTKGTLILKSSPTFTCFTKFKELDVVHIQFKTNHKVGYHNADAVENDTYIWTIHKEDKIKPVYIEVLYEEFVEEKKEDKNYSTLIFLIMGAILIPVIYFLLKKRKQNRDF